MPPIPSDTSWDFGLVLDLINNLEGYDVDPTTAAAIYSDQARDATPMTNNASLKNGQETVPSLGDFTRIYDYLGIAANDRLAVEPSIETVIQDSYNSDGAIYDRPAAKTVKWQDETAVDGTLSDSLKVEADGKPYTGLNRRQRKRLKWKLNRIAKQGTLRDDIIETDYDPPSKDWLATPIPNCGKCLKKSNSQIAFSDDESVRASSLGSKNPAKKASLHAITPETPILQQSHRSLRSGVKLSTPIVSKVDPTTPDIPDQFKILKLLPSKKARSKQKASSPSKPKPVSKPSAEQIQTPVAKAVPTFNSLSEPVNFRSSIFVTPRLESLPSSQASMAPQASMAQPLLVPSQVLPTTLPPAQFSPDLKSSSSTCPLVQPVQMGLQPTAESFVPSTVPHQSDSTLTIRYGEDRHLHFLLKLIHDFGEDKRWLVSPMQLSNNKISDEGIHVFVDASNILIGFKDTFKILQGLHPKDQADIPAISFDSLVLLMERRRPVAKRVIVGSEPLLPAFETAKAVGYEVSILHKVWKARELTERQKFFRKADRMGWSRASRRQRSRSASDSESEMATGAGVTPQPAKKLVEQGVDELLHLKMLESIVDAEAPSTIVLATGDAAEAEYSQGFMAMVARALKKGWKVELISWGKNISGAYRKRKFQNKWLGQFKIIELDRYVEDLLDT